MVLFLEDDFQVPESIPTSTVFFTSSENVAADEDANPAVEGAGSAIEDGTGSSGRRLIYTTLIEVEDGDYNHVGDDAWAIIITVPDMETRRLSSQEHEGEVNRFDQGDKLTLRITEGAGIKNDNEAGQYAIGYQILTPQEDIKDDLVQSLDQDDDDDMRSWMFRPRSAWTMRTTRAATTSSSQVAASTTSSNATAYVAQAEALMAYWNGLDCDAMNELVGSDDSMGSGYCRMWNPLSDGEKAMVAAAAIGQNKGSVRQDFVGLWYGGQRPLGRHPC